jgi:hypothetical protein
MFLWFDYITIIMFFIFIYGFIYNSPHVFVIINFLIKTSIAIYLIYRFNEFKIITKITKLDQKICFSAAMYLLIFSLADVFSSYFSQIRGNIKKFLKLS